MLTPSRNTLNDRLINFLSKFTTFLASYKPFTSTNGTALPQEMPAVLPAQPIDIGITHVQQATPVVILQVYGALNVSNYQSVIATAKALYQAGTRNIILDLSEVTVIGITSMVALHSIVLILQGKEPLDPEAGRRTLRAIADDLATQGIQTQLKLLNPQPHIKQILEQAGFKGFLEFYTDMEAAIASF